MTYNTTSTVANAVVGTARGMTGLKLSIHGTLKRLKWDWRRIDGISTFGGGD